ncbi:MAG: CDP-alcohol phosphatidyltransferase family protein [Acidimicrobiia bacterium]
MALQRSSSSVLTIPNAITLSRLGAVPWLLWLLFRKRDRQAAAILLTVLGTTDWVDGYVARRLGQVSELGKILDPTADRVLLGVAVTALLVDGSLPPSLAWAALTREAVVAASALALAAAGARRIDVQWSGKAGTLSLCFALPFFLASAVDNPDVRIQRLVAWIFGLAGLGFGYHSAYTYLPIAKRALAEGRAARKGRPVDDGKAGVSEEHEEIDLTEVEWPGAAGSS